MNDAQLVAKKKKGFVVKNEVPYNVYFHNFYILLNMAALLCEQNMAQH